MWGTWDYTFCDKVQPSIEYLELFALAAAVLAWIDRFKNRKIYLFCDNQSVVQMINNTTSSCRNCMVLLRLIVLQGLRHNVKIMAKYVRSHDNGRADALSRHKFELFYKLSAHKLNLEVSPVPIPEEIWPMQKIWLY